MGKTFTSLTFASCMFFSTAAQALLIDDADAVFDNNNDLLDIRLNIASAEVPVEGIFFDWDNGLQHFDMTGATLESSNVGGVLGTPFPGYDAGSLFITDMIGSPVALPEIFEFTISIPEANGKFWLQPIDLGVFCIECEGYNGDNHYGVNEAGWIYEKEKNFITPRRPGDIPPPQVPVPSVLALMLIGFGALGWSRKNRA